MELEEFLHSSNCRGHWSGSQELPMSRSSLEDGPPTRTKVLDSSTHHSGFVIPALLFTVNLMSLKRYKSVVTKFVDIGLCMITVHPLKCMSEQCRHAP